MQAIVGQEKGLNFFAQRWIGSAGFIEEFAPLLRRQLHGMVKDLFDVLPIFTGHDDAVRRISRCNQTRAVAQSRSTVIRERPKICEISGADNPPKNLSITHKLHSDHDAQLNVGEPRHASPDHGVTRWRIVCASEIAT